MVRYLRDAVDFDDSKVKIISTAVSVTDASHWCAADRFTRSDSIGDDADFIGIETFPHLTRVIRPRARTSFPDPDINITH
ncbi:hypothetical protein PUN28_007062 [Cardiocondyla obscurior]|uniref:Uncharacterized protein n=1 Tax=Cardiocondyla obscurior TaxID=286306 RepID=A0AAW2G4Q4_9HYME